MKRTLLNIGLVFILSLSALSQQTIDVEIGNSGGQLAVLDARQLQFNYGQVTSIGENGQPPFLGGSVGNVTFTTPPMFDGNIRVGGRFGSGGSFYIDSPWDVDISATFVSGTWTRSTLPNATYVYVLTGQIEGTMFLNGTYYEIQGLSVQLSTNTGNSSFEGVVRTSGGTTEVVTVPSEQPSD